MDSKKGREKSQKDVSLLRNDSTVTNRRHSNISCFSSEESLPIDAPLVRQPSSSGDIDTVLPELTKKTQINGIKSSNTYLDDGEFREYIQDDA